MRLLGILLVACVVLAAAQAVALALAVLLMVSLIYGLFTAPRETLGFVALLLVLGAFQAQPVACLAVIGLMIMAKVVIRKRH